MRATCERCGRQACHIRGGLCHRCYRCSSCHSQMATAPGGLCRGCAQPGALCLHCHARKASRPKGLCWRCYYTDGVALGHKPLSKYGTRYLDRQMEEGDICGGYSLPPAPTAAMPGTQEKMLVLAARVEARVALHHPLDAGEKVPSWLRSGGGTPLMHFTPRVDTVSATGTTDRELMHWLLGLPDQAITPGHDYYARARRKQCKAS